MQGINMDTAALGQIFLQVLRFGPVRIIPATGDTAV